MKIAGIVLIALEVMALLGSAFSGGFSSLGSVRGIGNLIGFLLPGIIGVILLIVAKKKENKI